MSPCGCLIRHPGSREGSLIRGAGGTPVASRYDDLDASTELEQQVTVDLRSALEGRGCEVVHHGTNSGGRHSPGGKPDIEVRDHPNHRLVLVEVTRRKSSSADGEFLAVTDHLQKSIAAGGYDDYGLLYVSPATSARMSSNFRDLWNRNRARDRKKGRIVAIDFAAAQMMLDHLVAAPSDLYPTFAVRRPVRPLGRGRGRLARTVARPAHPVSRGSEARSRITARGR